MITVRVFQVGDKWGATAVDADPVISTLDFKCIPTLYLLPEMAVSAIAGYAGADDAQIWQITDGLWEIHSKAFGDAPAIPRHAPVKTQAPAVKKETAAERKRRSRAGRVSVSFDLDPDMYQRLESLAKRYGSKKAALEAFLLSSDKMSLPI